MSSVVKGAIGAGTGLVAILGVSAIFISTEGFGLLSETPGEPLEVENSNVSWSNDAQAYSIFLVDPNKHKDGGEESWKLLSSNKSNLGYKFKDVTSGYNTSEENSLNKVCEEAYKSTWDTNEPETRASNKYDGRDIFTYCSPLRGLPKKLDNSSYGEGTIAKSQPRSSSFLVDSYGNYKFGKIKDKYFQTVDFSSTTTQDFFKIRQSKGIFLRDICREAYNSKETNSNSTPEAPKDLVEVQKYCEGTVGAN